MASNGDEETCIVRLRVRNTFYELYSDEPLLRRCKSEPVLCFDVTVTTGVTSTPRSSMSENSTASIVASPMSSNCYKVVTPSMSKTQRDSIMASLNLGPSDTTIMVRDLPSKVGYDRIMAELRSLGLYGCYDFLYCPKSSRDRSTFKGFCFINFMTHEAIELFVDGFANHQF
eukprot:TRINITY_DN69183_c0_g1_i1.p1 TRINITY_DN69183_c0_g1~~TRINITY_DN69183_c0_g1_i1.p1  ORF type:complete len:183 (-),score=17.95 TRINITY_DN69183_c0_g1_i1:15-530(-)